MGNHNAPVRLYRNTGSGMTLLWSSPQSHDTSAVAWADWDGDGNPDLLVGNNGSPNRLYANTGATLTLAWTSTESDSTTSLTWGDFDGDGLLDLAVGNDGYSRAHPHRAG